MTNNIGSPPASPRKTSASPKIACEKGVPLDLASLVEQTFRKARGHYGGQTWSPIAIELRAGGFPARLES